MYVILVYDIDKESKTKNKLFKLCKKYLIHVQNSVFEGDISSSNFMKLEIEINKLIDKNIDSVIIFSDNEEKWLNKKIIGLEKHSTSVFV